jgi:hypothetical protein
MKRARLSVHSATSNVSMKHLLLCLMMLAFGSANASAASVKVFVFAGPASQPARLADGFVDPSGTDHTLADSVTDIQYAVRGLRFRGLKSVDTRKRATLLVQVVGREEVNGAYVVHVRATFKGHQFDLTGAAAHQWRHSAQQIADQLSDWVRANQVRID